MPNLIARRIIAACFIILFLVIAPALILYTAGYRYNLDKNRISQTGVLVLKTEPTNAEIFINDEKISEKTPARLLGLFPEEYKIKIQKKGYHSWEKKLKIKIKETTFAENILLVKKTEPKIIFKQPISWFSSSPSKQKIIFKSEQKLYLFNPQTSEKPQTLQIYFTQQPNISWSKDENLFLFEKINQQKFLYNAAQTDTPVPNIQFSNFKNIKWSTAENNVLFAQQNNAVWKIKITGKKTKKARVFALKNNELLIDYFVQGQTIYYIYQNSGRVLLTKNKITDQDKQLVSPSLELSHKQFSITNIIDDFILLKNKEHLLLINDELDQIYLTKKKVPFFDYHIQKKQMAFTDTQEIEIFDLNSRPIKAKNLTRYSGGVKQVQILNPNYVAVLQNQKIHIMEVDDQDKRNITTLDIENIKFFTFTDEDEIAYITATGLFSLAF